MADKKLCTIYVVRHVESKTNVLVKQGLTYDPSLEETTSLSPDGIKQANVLAGKFKNIDFAAIISSNYTRAKETAAILKAHRHLDILISDAIGERHYGSWAGKWNQVKDTLQEEIRKIEEEKKNEVRF